MTVEGKTVLPFGDTPIGRLTYDAAGRTTAQVMRPGRNSSVVDPSAVGRSSEDELRAIAEGYVGYFGTFTATENSVTHHIEACTLPAWTGTDQRRQFEFAGNRLTLRFGPNKLVWERLPG
jgi:Lipocalin-like domain